MAGHHDPKLLYSIDNIQAYHIQNGEESSLTPSGPQTLSLLMVPTSSPFADLSNTTPQNEIPEEDFYLHLHLPPELDLPLPATTQIYHQPPRSYLIPRWDRGPESGVFTRIEFPAKLNQDDVDTFETILAQCTAFLERAVPAPEKGGSDAPPGYQTYNPADWVPGGKYGSEKHGQIVLVDEENGSVVGELVNGANVVEDPRLNPGRKDPVEIEVSADGKRVEVRPVSEDYLAMAKHPAYRSSSLVQNAAAASRLIVTGSSYLSTKLASGAENYTQKTKPREKPLTFSPATHERARKVHNLTLSTAKLSAQTVGQVTKYAQNFGASLSKRKAKPQAGYDRDGNEIPNYKPGFLNKSMIAFSTVADGLEASGRSLLSTSGAAASQVVGHKYGQDAGAMAQELAGGFKNVGLVYIDVAGVTRRAVIKSVAKGMVVGRVQGGGEIVVGGGDGGAVSEEDIEKMTTGAGVKNDTGGGPKGIGAEEGFGNAQGGPPAYGSELGEPMGSSAMKGKNTYI